MAEELVWVRYLDATLRFRCKNGKLDAGEICKKWKLDPASLCIGPDAIAVGDDGLSEVTLVDIRQAASEVSAGDGKSQHTPFLLEVAHSQPLQAAVAVEDRSAEICSLLAQPFAKQIDDSVEGLRNMLTRTLPTRLPVADSTYSRMSSSLREFFVPQNEFPADKLGCLITYGFLGSTRLRSGSSESATQVLWDDLMFKPMTEVVEQSGVTGIFIERNRTDPTGTTSEGTRPDMAVSCGELVIFEEEKKGGDLKVPTRELFEKLKMLSAMYRTSFVRRFIVGISAAGNTVAYYALDRERRQGPVLICGPIAVGAADHSTTRVLKCSFNCLRFVLTVDAERMARQMSPGPVLGLRLESRIGNISRTITFYPEHVKKTITPFSSHVACGFTRLEHVIKAYTQCEGWGKAWSVKPPAVDRRDKYSVEIQPVGLMRKPVTEEELKVAMRGVLSGLKMLHGMGLVHRDIRWPNVLYCEVGWFLMDFETVWLADEIPKCVRLGGWGVEMPLRDGRYTKQCDLWLAGRLCVDYDFSTPAFNEFRDCLLVLPVHSQLAVEAVLDHAWLQ